ncbi:MAG: thymidine phosphorylase [Armatimonadetes bacterium Cent15-Ar3]|nr:MAG: thymidine phosphorylase [Armatimonadetes bacterium Cent15-Ar3]
MARKKKENQTDIRSLIATRRDGGVHSREDLDLLCAAAADRSAPDYQLAAWLMAAYLKPLSEAETADFTLAMADSGQRLDLTGVPKPWVDKHSTGGVGDKTTLVLAPLLAACGLSVVKMSGRGLGITGGTLDKLLAIPGMTTEIEPQAMIDQAKKIGIVVAGQTADLAPADKTLYALRDVTETVSSLPLIVGSILSKKIAGGAETVVLDVKCGCGSFNPTREHAETLADALVRVGKKAGLNVYAAITDMEQPLGRAIGNALEVHEAIEVLTKPEDQLSSTTKRFRELVRYFAALTLRVSGLSPSAGDALDRVEATLSSGRALRKAQEWVEAQGATVQLSEEGWLVKAPIINSVNSTVAGCVSKVDARVLGEIALELGAGRKTKESDIDLAVGLEVHVKIGDFVVEGQPLVTVHARNDEGYQYALDRVGFAVSVVSTPVPPRPILVRPA